MLEGRGETIQVMKQAVDKMLWQKGMTEETWGFILTDRGDNQTQVQHIRMGNINRRAGSEMRVTK